MKGRLYTLRSIAVIGLLLAVTVVGLGAYVRLSNAGLGCPDWPGCYGQIAPPSADPGHTRPLEPDKAWKEMVHRYAAGTLGTVVLLLVVLAASLRRAYPQLLRLAVALLVVVVLQGLLGRFTVTWKLMPEVVVAHLIGGFLTITLLLTLIRSPLAQPHQRIFVTPWARIALLVLVGQILLGGWTSANYAAQVCPDFPTCHGEWWPAGDWGEGFTINFEPDQDHEYGKLSSLGRIAVHWTHRVGALVTTLVMLLLMVSLWYRGEDRATWWLFAALLIQVGLGIGNVLLQFPLYLAVAHNLGALFLLQVLVWINWPAHRGQLFRPGPDGAW